MCYLWILYFKDKQIFGVSLYLTKFFFYEYQCFLCLLFLITIYFISQLLEITIATKYDH